MREKLKNIIKIIINAINIILIIFTIALAFIAIFKKEWIEAFIEWMRLIVESIWYWNYFIGFSSSLIEAFPVIWVVIPGQNILLIVWWFFWAISYLNLIYLMIIASLWAIIWNYIWYILWKYYWDSFFTKYWNWFWIWLTEVKYLKKSIDKWWAWGIILWKFHPMTRAFLPFIAWSMWMKSISFMIYNIVWSIIRSVTIIWLGVVFVEYYEILLEHAWKIMFVILAIVWWYIYKYKRVEFMNYMKEKNAELEQLWKK